MILHLTYDTTRVALTIKHWPTMRRVDSWRDLHLVILPGQVDNCDCCHVGGSPWYLWGCWPGKLTGVDIANPPMPDFAPMFIPAHEYDDNGRIVFVLPERWRELAYGRYTGQIWHMSPQDRLLNALASIPQVQKVAKVFEKYKTPTLYNHADCSYPMPVHVPPQPTPDACILASFDIDYGYKCDEHIIHDAALEMSLSTCEEDV